MTSKNLKTQIKKIRKEVAEYQKSYASSLLASICGQALHLMARSSLEEQHTRVNQYFAAGTERGFFDSGYPQALSARTDIKKVSQDNIRLEVLGILEPVMQDIPLRLFTIILRRAEDTSMDPGRVQLYTDFLMDKRENSSLRVKSAEPDRTPEP